jgi:Uma2 family endonuclease
VHASSLTPTAERVDRDDRVILHGMTWKDFEIVLAVRGDAAGVRMYYLDGDIELMSPSRGHEGNKTWLARLLELWAIETNTKLEGFGSWTLKEEAKSAGAEPDECYIVGDPNLKNVPDFAIEVAWSRGGLHKLEIYERLGVRELWMMHRDGTVEIYVLEKARYVLVKKSHVLPTLDVAWLAGFLKHSTQHEAVLALRSTLRAQR